MDQTSITRAYATLRINNLANKRQEITDVGGLPYSIVRPILLRLDSAAQLRVIEEASPHIALDDAECWLRLIDKKFSVLHQQNQLEPRNPASWHKVYAQYARQDAAQKAEAEAKLKNAFAGLNARKEANRGAVVDLARSSLPRPPRDMRNVGRKPAVGRRGGTNDTGELKFTAGSRTKTNTAASVMRRVKREAAEVRARNKLATPNGALRVRDGQIRQAPQGMVHEQRVRHNPAVKIHPPPTAGGIVGTEGDPFRDRVMEEREARLRKLKAQGKSASILEDSDFEDGDDDDVFGGGGGGGGGVLNVDELEELFDEDDDDNHGRAVSPPRRTAALPGKKKGGLLSNSYKASSQQSTYHASSSRSRSPTRATPSSSTAPVSPPTKYAPPAGSPELKPRMPLKRKAVDVFMKKKPKVQRR
jgi:elongin-A